jgi:hypothetical protein
VTNVGYCNCFPFAKDGFQYPPSGQPVANLTPDRSEIGTPSRTAKGISACKGPPEENPPRTSVIPGRIEIRLLPIFKRSLDLLIQCQALPEDVSLQTWFQATVTNTQQSPSKLNPSRFHVAHTASRLGGRQPPRLYGAIKGIATSAPTNSRHPTDPKDNMKLPGAFSRPDDITTAICHPYDHTEDLDWSQGHVITTGRLHLQHAVRSPGVRGSGSRTQYPPSKGGGRPRPFCAVRCDGFLRGFFGRLRLDLIH